MLFSRITPAYAGKTFFHNFEPYIAKDHPRVCGKDATRNMATRRLSGSPPRMRERLLLREQAEEPVGITPAYAGKTEKNC